MQSESGGLGGGGCAHRGQGPPGFAPLDQQLLGGEEEIRALEAAKVMLHGIEEALRTPQGKLLLQNFNVALALYQAGQGFAFRCF